MVVISGSSHSQAPWWRKKNSNKGQLTHQASDNGSGSNQDGNKDDHSLAMDAENSMDNLKTSKPKPDNVSSKFFNGKQSNCLDGQTLTRAALCHAN